MEIKVMAKTYFEKIKGTPEEKSVMSKWRVVSISNSSDETAPFSKEFLKLPTLLLLHFGDVSNPDNPDETGQQAMTAEDARRIVSFVLSPPHKPILIHCTDGSRRSTGIALVLNDYLNRILRKNMDDYESNNRLLHDGMPNFTVRRLLIFAFERRVLGKVDERMKSFSDRS